MAYDACGTTKLEGKDILALLAAELAVEPALLKRALVKFVDDFKINEPLGCGCDNQL